MKLFKSVELVKDIEAPDGTKRNDVVLRLNITIYRKSGWAAAQLVRDFPELIDRDTLLEKNCAGARRLKAEHILKMRADIRKALVEQDIPLDCPRDYRSGFVRGCVAIHSSLGGSSK